MTLRKKIFSSRILKTLLVLLSTTLFIACDQLIPKPSTSDDSTPTYTVTYNANNSDSGSVPTDTNNYEEEQTVTTKINSGSLTRSGYTFNGWNTSSDSSGTSYATEATFSMGAANVILYARWTQNPTYTVTYNKNNATSGSVPTDSNNYEEGQTVTVKTNSGSLARSGYSFNNWNTQADGNGQARAAEASFSIGSDNVTLYAQWTPVYTVTYNANNATSGSVPTDSNTYANGATVTVKTNSGSLSRSGYTFNNWNTQADGNGTARATGSAFSIGSVNVTLYAQWTVVYSVQLGSDIDGEAADNWSGKSVSLSDDGSIVAIGAYGNSTSRGHVRVYQYASGSWSQLGSDIDGEAANDRSGFSISLNNDGTIVAIGATGDDGTGPHRNNTGHVRVYQYASGSWNQLGSDIDGEVAEDYSGWSVNINGDGSIVAIGAYRNRVSKGHVRVYQYANSSWSQLGSDIDGEWGNDESGWSVSLSNDGSIVAIGARYNESRKGHVRVYQYISGSWSKLGADIDGEAADNQSGYAVSLSDDGSIVAIGAPGNDNWSGHVRVYKYASGSWSKLGVDIDGEAANDESGYAVSLSSDGSILAIGASYNDGTASDSGHVRVYK